MENEKKKNYRNCFLRRLSDQLYGSSVPGWDVCTQMYAAHFRFCSALNCVPTARLNIFLFFLFYSILSQTGLMRIHTTCNNNNNNNMHTCGHLTNAYAIYICSHSRHRHLLHSSLLYFVLLFGFFFSFLLFLSSFSLSLSLGSRTYMIDDNRFIQDIIIEQQGIYSHFQFNTLSLCSSHSVRSSFFVRWYVALMLLHNIWFDV